MVCGYLKSRRARLASLRDAGDSCARIPRVVAALDPGLMAVMPSASVVIGNLLFNGNCDENGDE